jgi:hypothetical protein
MPLEASDWCHWPASKSAAGPSVDPEFQELPLPFEVGEHDTPAGLNITWSSPAGPESPVVGSYLSQIFSNRYILATKRVDGSVARIRHDPDPTLTRLIPANYADRPGRIMPLTVFRQQPSTNGRPDGTD